MHLGTLSKLARTNDLLRVLHSKKSKSCLRSVAVQVRTLPSATLPLLLHHSWPWLPALHSDAQLVFQSPTHRASCRGGGVPLSGVHPGWPSPFQHSFATFSTRSIVLFSVSRPHNRTFPTNLDVPVFFRKNPCKTNYHCRRLPEVAQVPFFLNPWTAVKSLVPCVRNNLKKYPDMTIPLKPFQKGSASGIQKFHGLWNAHKRQFFSPPTWQQLMQHPLGNGVLSLAHWKNPSSCDSMFCIKSVKRSLGDMPMV